LIQAGSVLLLVAFLVACSGDMRDQPRYEPLEQSEFFADGSSARLPVQGSVSWDEPVENPFLTTGSSEDGEFLEAYPFDITLEVIERGRERYDIFCSPCHGLDGYGQGMIVQRGFSPPPSLHTDRLRQMPAGQIFDVITHGFGQMYSYAERIEVPDRWAIVAYIRSLQLSQNARLEDVPPEEVQYIQEAEQ
jgi:mono/diheme cytochrome c family protein